MYTQIMSAALDAWNHMYVSYITKINGENYFLSQINIDIAYDTHQYDLQIFQ